MSNAKTARSDDDPEKEEGFPLLPECLSDEGLLNSGSATSKERNHGSSTRQLTYRVLLSCAVALIMFMSFLLGRHLGVRHADRRCMEHVSMYCMDRTDLSRFSTFIAHAFSACLEGHEPAYDVHTIQWNTWTSDRMDRRSKPRARRNMGKVGARYMRNVSIDCQIMVLMLR